MNSSVALILENFSIKIRKILEIESERIININDLDDLIVKINNTFSFIKIEEGYDMLLELTNNGKNYIINYDKKATLEERFEFIIKAFCHSLLFDKKNLNYYELQNGYYVPDYKIYCDENTNYLTKALMISKKQFLHELVKFSTNDGHVDIVSMQKTLKNKNLYSRGRDLKLW